MADVTASGSQDLLSIQITGLAKLSQVLTTVGEALDADDLVTEAGAIMLARIRARFLDQVDPDGNKWVPSKASLRRKKSGRDGGTLFDTGALWNSIQLAKGGFGEIFIGTDIPYARKHQEGLEGNEERVFLGFGSDDETIITTLLKKRIEQALLGAGA